MSLTITDQVMRSTDTPHTAAPWPGPREDLAEYGPEETGWTVTWLPGRLLTRDEAVTAMTIAAEVGRIPADAGPEAYSPAFWVLIDPLAAELGLTGPDAAVRASEPPAGIQP